MKNLCLFALLFLLFNCSPPNVSYERIFENNSSYDIWLINPSATANCTDFTDIGFQDSVLVPSNTSKVIESSYDRNASVSDYADCPSLCLGVVSSRISNHDSLSLNASLEDSNTDWAYRVINSGESGSCECQLTITDADIN